LWVDQVVEAMYQITGCSPLFLSDLSAIGDFPLEQGDFTKLSEDLGIEVRPEDTFVDLAKKLKKAQEV
jgi:hypothetical protein